ncbi:MAG: hypothetical protein CME64_03680 [Halobacteriovoraceae bacterium]|nr:hypothetical protein [Halobacteriovoraceae bacterium]|tara:strand:- start:15237 stop:16826 length:1590 start_codon:yes stop_codon:yes gene_type:complete
MFKIFAISLIVSGQLFAAYLVKQTVRSGKVQIESVQKINKIVDRKILLKDIREAIAEKEATANVQYQEWLIPNGEITSSQKKVLFSKKFEANFPNSEVRELVKTGRDENRIVLAIIGDGYTLEEKDKYFGDVNRMVDDLFREITFKSYLPLFNIYVVFTPSNDSGITDLVEKDTAFGLYRAPKGSKRGVMPGDRLAMERALRLASNKVDYPIVIANDDYYGGLGGRYAITTRSLNSGSMVLRHELGHNFSNVGEEYDGGQVYSGANFSRSSNVPWKHWVKGKTQVHKAKFLTGAYVWKDLTGADFVDSFKFPNMPGYTFSMKLSSVGWTNDQEVKVMLDGKELELDGVFTKDRSFFNTVRTSLSSGEHEIRVQDHSHDGDNVLAYANAYAFPKDYNFTHGVVGAFNVFDAYADERGFRPTHNQCLMRNMRSKVFCPVDQENIWLRFFKVVDLIDEVKVEEKVRVETVDLDNLDIRWFKRGFWGSEEELEELRGKREVSLPEGKYLVEVEFKTKEIRKQKVIDKKKFQID